MTEAANYTPRSYESYQQEVAQLRLKKAAFWAPHEGQQVRFMRSPAFEALFGGAAGPGKTDCLLMEALRQIDHPRYNAMLFRRTFPRLEGADGLIVRSMLWFPGYGGKYNSNRHYWTFPSGARIYFAHLQHEEDKHQYQGWQLAYIGFDELTEFTETQYTYLFTRCRADADSGLRCYVRAATNPGNIGHEWVKRRFVTKDIVNRVGYFARINEADAHVERTHPDALSRAFYPARMEDNPSGDPEYRKRILLNPDPVERERLLAGNWDIMDTSGRVYANWSYENISTEAEFNPDWDVIWGVDDGYAEGNGPGSANYHPRTILLGQVTPTGGINIFAEYYKTLELSENALDNVLELPYPMPQVAYVDSSAAELKARIWERGINTVGATHRVAEGIKNVRRLIADGQGVRQLKVHPRCQQLIGEIAGYKYDEASKVAEVGEPKPLKIDDHGPDTLRYMAWSLRYGQ